MLTIAIIIIYVILIIIAGGTFFFAATDDLPWEICPMCQSGLYPTWRIGDDDEIRTIKCKVCDFEVKTINEGYDV